MCSDGIFDARLDGIRIDEERVAELLSGTRRPSAQDLVDRITGALQGVERPPRDDVAIMVLRRTGPDEQRRG